ncbi:Hypothetical predicted protein [Lecanosticta acicola]|uniref:Uncharacterized protein n=1 Tax=Lecanosticta acicola TaxID=111012 RepID=A0AAI8Z975_9PEZI|nr:Hypothetical predicted protein [Lecanosticta acicola]
MSSGLPDTLLRDTGDDGNIRRRLFHHLDNESLRRLRQTSVTLNTAVLPLVAHRIFRNLYSYAPLRENDSVATLEEASQHCQHLTLNVSLPPVPKLHERQSALARQSIVSTATVASTATKRPRVGRKIKELWDKGVKRAKEVTNLRGLVLSEAVEGPNADIVRMDRRLWEYIFKLFPSLVTLTFRIHGNPAWPGLTELEEMLIMLRYCLERSSPPKLRHINFTPIHAFGIIHLRWAGFGAYFEVPTAGMKLWENITSLTLHLQNPLTANLAPSTDRPASGVPPINTNQNDLFLKSLNAYLRSFSRTLRKLEFIWLHLPGPSPIQLIPSDVYEWILLEEFRFGNIRMPNRTVQLIPEFMPRVEKCMALKEGHRSRPEAEDAWVEVPMRRMKRGSMRMDHPAFRGSRVFTGEGAEDVPRQSVVSGPVERMPRVVEQATGPRGQSAHLRFSHIRRELNFVDTDSQVGDIRGSVHSDWTEMP